MLTPAWTQFRPHAVQQALWCTKKRFAIVPAGRGSGKTELAKRRLVRFLPVIKDIMPTRYFYGAPTFGQAKRIAWESINALIPPDWIESISLSELCITTRFNSKLYILGLDQPQRIEGDQWDGCVIDENSDIKPGTFRLSVLPALTHRNGWCWRIGVPKRQGIGAIEFRTAFETAHDTNDTEAFSWPSSDILPSEVLDDARQHMDPKDYNEQFNATFETSGGGIFHGFDSAYNVRPCMHNPAKAIIIGSDFNVDPMCWVIGHHYTSYIEFFDEIFVRNTNTQKTLDMLYERYKHHQAGFQFYGDATARARKTAASETDYRIIANDKRFARTIHYPNSNPLVADRFSVTNAALCSASGNRRVFIDSRCQHLIDDLTQRHYKPGTNEPNDVGDLGHMTDALGYPLWQLFPMKFESEGKPAIFVSGVR